MNFGKFWPRKTVLNIKKMSVKCIESFTKFVENDKNWCWDELKIFTKLQKFVEFLMKIVENFVSSKNHGNLSKYREKF